MQPLLGVGVLDVDSRITVLYCFGAGRHGPPERWCHGGAQRQQTSTCMGGQWHASALVILIVVLAYGVGLDQGIQGMTRRERVSASLYRSPLPADRGYRVAWM